MSLSKEKKASKDVAPTVSEAEKPTIQDYESKDENKLGKTRIIEEPAKEGKRDRRDS